jgi:hypothetical protein
LRQFLIGFTLDFTGMTANAFAGILGEMVPAHENSPLVFLKIVAKQRSLRSDPYAFEKH